MPKRVSSILSFCALALAAAGFQSLPDRAPRAKPTPPPLLALEGSVSAEGKPVAGALVIARSALADFLEPPLTTRSDAKGLFRIPLKDPGPYTVRAEAGDWGGTTLERVRPGAPLRITLGKGAVIQGLVRDGGSGQPIAGARVDVRDNKAVVLPMDPEAGTRSALTDEHGRFRISGLSANLQSVTATLRGYAAARRPDAKPGSTLELYMFPGASVSGTVRGVDGSPVAGAVVRAESDGPLGPAGRPEITRADGGFEIAGLAAGTYRLLARHRDFAPAVSARVTLQQSEAIALDLALERGGVVSGRLVDGEGRAASRGRVSVSELNGQPPPRTLADLLRADAASDGRFRLPALPPGDHALTVSAEAHGARRVEARASAGADTDLGDIALEAGLLIRGTVRDRAGVPVADARVTAFQPRPAEFGFQPPAEARSQADGSFVVGGLSTGVYRVTARATGYGEASRQLDAGSEKVELVLAPAGSISGQAVDDEGRPIETFRVDSRPIASSPSAPTAPRSLEVSSADGRFSLEDVPEGTHVLSVSAPERVSAAVSNVKVAGGAATDVGRVRLSAGGVVRGHVVDATGAGIAGASVSARGASRDMFRPGFGPQAMSDAGGAFELRGVPLGTIEVTATHPNYAAGRTPGLEVDPAKGPTEARVVLSLGGRIEGFARTRDGRPLSASVQVVPLRSGTPFVFEARPSLQQLQEDGSYVVEHVPAGRVAVNLMGGSGGMFMTVQNKEVDVREGESVRVDFVSQDILVSGRVTRAGAPASGMRVSLRLEQSFMMFMSVSPGAAAPQSGPQRGTALTRADGSYELLVSAPGKAFVSVQSADGKSALPSRTAVIPDADTHVLDLDFAGAPVTGVVVDADSEEPLAQVDVFAALEKPGDGAAGGGRAVSGPDGRFQLELEPGSYRVSARMSERDYGSASVHVDVNEAGASELRLALRRGVAIVGRLIDSAGRGVGGQSVTASAGEPPQASFAGATTQPDGSFRLGGLRDEPHTVAARSDMGAFAIRTGVPPGDRELLLTLRPGGRLRVQVVGPDERPIERASVVVSRYRGAPISGAGGGMTDAGGSVELMVPAGALELRVRKDRLEGSASASVTENGVAAIAIALAPMPER
jgi:protocatechuate 3,4-dioxygenase beta subunit